MLVERILLIRHAETAWNAEGRWQGHEPVSLNDTGRQQAQKLADYLSARPIGSVYSSDLPRARETAALLAQALALTVIEDHRLREWHLGVFQGLTRDEIQSRFPHEFQQTRENYFDFIVPRGESRRQTQVRAHAAFNDIFAAGLGPEVAIVTHGGTLRLLLYKLFESDAPSLAKIDFANTSITTIERHADHWRIVGLAATPHLIA
ncbi:MAG: histidine phosphatase family protein [Chloroflexi bacterium]|nr:histidine phosphatase family protein [Chloroflexota bacterium]